MKKKIKISRKKEAQQLRKANAILHRDIIRKSKKLLEIETKSVTEECSDCGREAMIFWNVRKDGYQTYCPYCGWPMMLCSMCLDEDGTCNWDGQTGICYRMVERLWKDLTDVPFQEDEDGRLIFEKEYVMKCGTRVIKTLPAGTDREEIWHWFDEMHPKGVAYLLNGEEKNDGKYNGRSEWIFAGGSQGRC